MNRAIALGLLLLLPACASSPSLRANRAAPSPGVVGAASTTSPALAVEPWTFNGRVGQAITTPSYRIFTTQRDTPLADRLPGFMEASLANYTTAIAPLPPPRRRLDFYVLSNRAEWARLTRDLLGEERASRYLHIERGGFSDDARAVLFNIGLHDTLAIAAHEGWHQYTQSAFAEPLPAWLDEGLAAWMEGFRWDARRPDQPLFLPWANIERFDHLRAAWARGQTVPLQTLLESRPEDLIRASSDGTLTYYSQVWALAHFLNEGDEGRYRNAMRRLLLDAAEGRMRRAVQAHLGQRAARSAVMRRTGPEVFLTYFDDDLDAVSRRYADFIDRLVATGAKDRIIAGRSPVEP
ncbi:MAG: hypothetical protein DYG93_00315 [Leptolyngbya sp. PLA2]|nr:hypothetical protein [Leptolyngbya sp. PL-A2]MCQ3940161.1 hypothetical protein [cyanobacterium CYA1]MCZ7632714.1 hypothetical protein [Phycisphaerales bacterium]MDL1904102.1 hypothetical protein [Synechococcales cyanobacterium CNB]GIK20145.1 MAG: hypothetical protein BroJett004_23090 [Planctomycetota bacterium]